MTKPRPPRPCAVCGKPVPQGQGVTLGATGQRVCFEELAKPLAKPAATPASKGGRPR
jgi:hypothetical protein